MSYMIRACDNHFAQNYPNPHSHQLNCNWHIIAPLGNNISVAFTSLILEHNSECFFDHINISEISRKRPIGLKSVEKFKDNFEKANFTKKAKLCGNHTNNLPEMVVLNKNEAMITFVSDDSRSIGSKFRLEWSAKGCGGHFISRTKGHLSSPNFPNPYPLELECLWTIQVPFGQKVDLQIHFLDIEFSKDCVFDYLKVYGGPDTRSPLLTSLCNKASNIFLSSLGNTMTVEMFSDLSSSGNVN